jgi:hypothetical protein
MRLRQRLKRRHRAEKFPEAGCSPRRSRVCAPVRKGGNEPLSLKAIVDDYIRNYRVLVSYELRFFKTQSNVKDAIRLAALARTPWDTRHDHQHRIPQGDLERWRKALTARIKAIQSCESFQELFELIESVGKVTKGIGELATYDTAQRIGAYLGLSPKVVYLHAGTRKGARVMRLGQRQAFLEMKDLPRAFSRLRPHEVEDCLCIYAEHLANLQAGQ